MLSKVRFFFTIFAAIIGCTLSTPRSISAADVTIDPRVLEDTASERVGKFLVILKSQADTRIARSLSREPRARFVFDALHQSAVSSQSAPRAQLDALGAKYRAYWIVNMFAVEGNRAVVDAMAARSDVAEIVSNRAFRVTLEKPDQIQTTAPAGIEWNIGKVNAPAVWAKGFTGQGRVYANADTGVQWDHPALKPHYRGWNGTTADHNYNWWDAIHSVVGSGSNPCGISITLPCDDYGHGTHTMGTGIGDDGAGNQIGVAPGAKWISCRNMERGNGQPSTYIECFQFFLAPTDLNGNNPDPTKRPDAIGNSYDCPVSEGCTISQLHVMQSALEQLRAAGIFMAASAGNAGASCSTIDTPPALEDSAITVGATDSNDNIAVFSSRGPVTIDGSNRLKPDLVAPGTGVRSSVPSGYFGSCSLTGYCSLSGTSMASPHVAAAAVLLWSAFPQLRGNVNMTELILEQNAVHLTSTQGCGGDSSSAIPNNVFGYGRIDLLAAFNYASGLYYPFKYFWPIVGGP